MKKKIVMGSIFAAILMLSMPLISGMQAQTKSVLKNNDDETPFRKIFLNCPLILFSGRIDNKIPLKEDKYLFISTQSIHQLDIFPRIGEDLDFDQPSFKALVLFFDGEVREGGVNSWDSFSGSGTVIILD
jgi:hypothetical protein